jgi:hypothetical protein
MFLKFKKNLAKSRFVLIVFVSFLLSSILIGIWSANYINPLGGLENGTWRNSRITNLQSYVKNISYTWDSKHYTNIAESGYKEMPHYAFFPLFPAEIRLIHNLTFKQISISTSAFIASAINSLILCFVVYLFYIEFIAKDRDQKQSKKLLLLTLLLPFSLFFWVPYTESLFISLLLICFGLIFKHTDNPRLIWLLSIFTFLLGLTRSIGVMFSVSIVAWVILNHKFYREKLVRLIPVILAIIANVAGLVSFLYFGYLKTGNFWISREVQKFWGRSSTINIFEPILNNFNVLISKEAFLKSCDGYLDCLNGWYYTGIAIALFLAILAITLKTYWKNKMFVTLTVFSVLAFVLPLSSNSTGSINRYILACPIYLLLLPKILLDKIPEEYHYILFSVLSIGQGVLFVMYTGHFWVG